MASPDLYVWEDTLRILLISPRFDAEYTRATAGMGKSIAKKRRSLMVPLHLATVAALTPDDVEVDIYDESVLDEITAETNFGKDYDLVGVTGYIAHLPRAKELARIFRKRGVPTVIGGSGVSGSPDTCRDVFDVLLLGEAELTWPRFLREWMKGSHLKEYRQVDRPDLSESPAPRWGNVAGYVDRYAMGGVQTTRGCPFDCEFCDVIHLYGRKPRHKQIDRVLAEVIAMEKLGMRVVFMCDDDFIGHKKYAKDLVRELVSVNNSFSHPLAYTTQLTIDLAQDDELLRLMADANFGQVLVGIETPRKASLVEMNKPQNLRGDLVEDVKKIQSYGISVRGSLVVGFDADDIDTFDEHIRFIDDANICSTNINTLKAYPGTPLWVRMQREDRVIDVGHIYSDAPRVVSNIIPKQMTRVELLENYRRLLMEARSWDRFRGRVQGFLNGVAYRGQVRQLSLWQKLKLLPLVAKGIFKKSDLPPEVRKQIRGIVAETFKKAPHLMGHVIGLVLQQAMDHRLLAYHGEVIQKQIDDWNAGPVSLDKDASAGTIPKDFHKSLSKAMPVLYDRLSAEIHYKPCVSEAMVDVLKDFVIRWGANFKDFEPHHFVYLNELCDRHVQRWNEKSDVAGVVNGDDEPLTADRARTVHFIKGLLVAVEQELRGASRPRKASAGAGEFVILQA